MIDYDSWTLAAQGTEVQTYLRACRLLNIPVQTRNDDKVLLIRESGMKLMDLVRQASTMGWIRSAPIDVLARSYKADPDKFEKSWPVSTSR